MDLTLFTLRVLLKMISAAGDSYEPIGVQDGKLFRAYEFNHPVCYDFGEGTTAELDAGIDYLVKQGALVRDSIPNVYMLTYMGKHPFMMYGIRLRKFLLESFFTPIAVSLVFNLIWAFTHNK